MLVNPHVPSKLCQGITTEITGEGVSVAPLDERVRASYAQQVACYGIRPDWSRFADCFARLERQGIAIKVASYVGATRLRFGIRYVFVNGVPVIADGRETLRLPGHVVRGPGYRGGSTR